MQNSKTILWGFFSGGGEFWGEVTSKGLFFQYLYSTTTASLSGLCLKYCTKSSYIAVYTLMKIIAVQQ